MSVNDIALVISALGLGAVLNSVVKAITEKRKVGADTTSVLTAAALTLVEPLRTQLQAERAERAAEHQQHIAELRDEREAAGELRDELDSALAECRTLRSDLASAHDELTRLRARLDGA